MCSWKTACKLLGLYLYRLSIRKKTGNFSKKRLRAQWNILNNKWKAKKSISRTKLVKRWNLSIMHQEDIIMV